MPAADSAPEMAGRSLDIVILGLSITSSWGNGHATTYRALVRALHERGHRVLFLERNVSWYAQNRDLEEASYCKIKLYDHLEDLERSHAEEVSQADAVVVGSYVPEGVAVGEWAVKTARGVTAFYDIDTPVTLAKLARNDTEYLSPDLIPRFDLYLSFTGGTTLERLEKRYGAQRARPLYCSVDPALYFPQTNRLRWDLGYMGTYSPDRQPGVEELLLEPAQCLGQKRFVVAGPGYPESTVWPANLERIDHLPPSEHAAFYNGQSFTLNITRDDMKEAGYAPSVRLFEAAACGTPIVSDRWEGLETFFKFDREILVARSRKDVMHYLTDLSEGERQTIGERARQVVLQNHTAAHRAQALEAYIAGQ